jgi:hypothetical protein
MEKIYLEIGSTIGAVLLFIILVIFNNSIMVFSTFANYGNAAILLLFIIIVGIIGVKLSNIED